MFTLSMLESTTPFEEYEYIELVESPLPKGRLLNPHAPIPPPPPNGRIVSILRCDETDDVVIGTSTIPSQYLGCFGMKKHSILFSPSSRE